MSKRQSNTSLTNNSLSQSLSQRLPSQTVIENLDNLANDCVRFILSKAGANKPISKTIIQKHALIGVGRHFDKIIDKAKKILKQVYGYDLYCDDSSNVKKYLVANTLPYNYNTTDDTDDIPEDVHKIIIMLILTHILLSKGSVNEDSIYTFFKAVNIDMEETHAIFGNVKRFVTVTMVNQKYLNAIVDNNTQKISYTWGPKAEHEVSKKALYNFVCKMYQGQIPKCWMNRFEALVNHEDHDESMEIN